MTKATITLTIAAAVFVALCAALWWVNTHYPILGMAIVIVSCWAVIYKMFYSELITNKNKKIIKMENPKIDWEQRRYEIAKAVLPKCISTAQEVLASGGRLPYNSLAETCASNAVSYADELIKQLKGGSE